MDFPAQTPRPCETPAAIVEAFARTPSACLKAEDYIVIFADEDTVRSAQPDLVKLKQLDLRGVAISAAARDQDFICRFFAPNYGIDEDPVTGSAYTQLVPYWSNVLHKKDFMARQVSNRGGDVKSSLAGDRVIIAGKAVLFLTGHIDI
jgi:predicted PhzF superfamily epimerase YddE/YHI9